MFGAPGKRRLLEALLAARDRPLTQAELARAAELHPKGSADEHLLVLVQLGVVIEEAGRYRLDPRHPLVRPLGEVLGLLAAVPDAPLKRPQG